MADEQAVTPADSAPAEIAIPTGAAYDRWRMTGEVSKTEDSATSETETKETPAEESAPSTSETSADSEPAPPQEKARQKTKADTERRFQELLSERKAKDQRIAELERLVSLPREEKQVSQPAETKTELPNKPKIDDVDDKGQPKFKTYAQYEDARDAWIEQKAVSEMETRWSKSQQEQQAAQRNESINKGFQEKIVAARTKYPDFDAVALDPELPIPPNSVAETFVSQKSKHGAEVLYYLGQHRDELAAIQKLDGFDQLRELLKIESKFGSAPPVKTVSTAPAPPKQVGGNVTVNSDAVDSAIEEGDQAAYAAAANARDLARLKKRA